MQGRLNIKPAIDSIRRIQLWYAFLLFIMAIFLVRLFYLQIIRHDYYKKAALQAQMKEYEIKAPRGTILAHEGRTLEPIVLNETRYTLFADPKFINDHSKVAEDIKAVIGGNVDDYVKKMKSDGRFVVLAKKLLKDQKEKIDQLKIKGIGTRDESYRTYPEGDLAAQLLGFVNDDGEGKYGIEQYLNNELSGKPGQLKAITDAQGIPLVASKDNLIKQPEPGKKVVLTVNVSMQRQLQDILKAGLDKALSASGSAVIMDPYSGAIKAMANYPTYHPADFYKIEDASVFNNAVVSAPLEVGSVMKPLTAAAALNQKVVNRNTTYYDPSVIQIDDAKISNIEEDGGPGTRSLADILQLSLNTGAVFLLQQMGGGEVNKQARTVWYDYMVNKYGFGSKTGIEQGFEAEGSIPDPINGFGLNIQFANTAFGQGMTATPLQMAGALSSVINGGTYYQPHLVDHTIDSSSKAHYQPTKVTRQNVVSAQTGKDVKELMEYVVSKNYLSYGMKRLRGEFGIGGKTGTAEVPKPGGGYYDDRFNGMFIGFVGGDRPEYVIVVRVNEPKIAGYAGARAAAPIFAQLTDMLIDNFGVTPKSK